jgi:hypothetical protein
MASWEDLYQGASPAQQAELLALARAQGVVYGHQLPAANGAHGAPPAAGLNVLSRLLGGRTDAVQPVRPGAVAVVDETLDGPQRDAVARALGTSDLCLIQGLPGSGKSRVIAEILTQAAGRGERVLLLAPTGAALDRVLETVAGRSTVYALRCLGRDEPAEGLPVAVRGLTFAERARVLREESLPKAVQARTRAEERCRERGREENVWPQLLDYADSHGRLDDQLDGLRQCAVAAADEIRTGAAAVLADGAPASPAGAAGPFLAALAEAVRVHREKKSECENALAAAERQRDQVRQELTELEARQAALRPFAEARQHGRWWTPTWWRALFGGNVRAQWEQLQAEHQQRSAALDKAGQDVDDVNSQIRAAAEGLRAETGRLQEAEIARRQAEFADQEAALRHEAQLLEGKWQRLCGELAPEVERPTALTPEAAQQSLGRWQALRSRDEQSLAFARQWVAYLETSAADLSARLPGYANVVATTLGTLPTDEHFGDRVSPPVTFDLLVFDEAEHVTESDLLKVARRARRWVLVGEPTPDGEAAPPPNSRARPRSRLSPPAPAALTPGCFQRLWDVLHCDPSRLPYVWVKEQERLCCRLRPVAPEQRTHLESERVADFPDIELRILTLPRSTPVLAEVLFPPKMSIEEAKGYIFCELQELSVQAVGRSVRWVEQAGCVSARIGDCPDETVRPVTLEPGVRELVAAGVCGTSSLATSAPLWHTCRLDFDCAQGWGRERAEEWLYRHLRLRDLGRTVCLETLHRMTPPLAAVLADWLWDGAGHAACATGNDGQLPAVEFVAVPPLERPVRKDHPAVPKAGAGLELDLSGPRHSDRLPTELRSLLPREGLVNYLEAQAVVRKVKQLHADPALRAVGAADGAEALIGVMTLYPAQVILIRELLRRAALPAGGPAIEVGVPGAFRHRECLAAVVSLTRSHSHRAVPLGEAPHLLPLALTRPRAKLVLVGDPGTLARRSQWQGALDYLDERVAAREGRLAGRLLGYMHGQGAHARAFRLCEGHGP